MSLGLNNFVINAMEAVKVEVEKSAEIIKKLTEANNSVLKENKELKEKLSQYLPEDTDDKPLKSQ